MMLFEKYRPNTLADVVGQPRATEQAHRIIGKGGRAVWLRGPSGSGKTSIARILAESIAEPICIAELVARDLTASAIRDIEAESRLGGFGKGGRAWIVNEAHGLQRQAVERLLDFLERIPPHVLVIFTTTDSGQARLFDQSIDAGPLLDRCELIETVADEEYAVAIAAHAQIVAQAEGLETGQDLGEYVELLESHRMSARALLQALARGVFTSKPTDSPMTMVEAAWSVLRAATEPMTTAEIVTAMAQRGLWASETGKTPAATLYTAILRDKSGRFTKAERGRFRAA